jgi:hypothetical protein
VSEASHNHGAQRSRIHLLQIGLRCARGIHDGIMP